MGTWDDGSHTLVRRVLISYGSAGISSIQVDYDSNGLFPAPKHGGDGDQSAEVTLNYPGEYLIAVTGYYTTTNTGDVITAVKFQSNQRTFGLYGNKTRQYFSIYIPKDNQIIGFHGKSSNLLNSLEVHYGPVIPVNPDGLYGGKGGLDWSDGTEYSGVKKIEISYDDSVIHSIMVTYDQTGSTIPCQRRGGDGGNKISVELGFPDEYLIYVSGYYSAVSSTSSDVVIKSLTLITNKKQYGPYGKQIGTPFQLSSPNQQIIGLRGRSGAYLNAIGAYYGPIPTPTPSKPEEGPGPYGSAGGLDWDDGNEYTGVKKIEIGYDDSIIHSITVNYDQTGSDIEAQRRGGDGGTKIHVMFKYPDEYLVSVSGTYSDVGISSLALKTNKNTYGPYGKAKGNAFILKSNNNNNQIIGFRGTSGAYLNSLGAYFGSIPTPAPAKELVGPGPYGSTGGLDWNDGNEYSGVKKIVIGYDNSIIHSITVNYDQTGSDIEAQRRGGDGGNKTTIEFKYPDEYLISVSGTFSDTSITSLSLKSNKTTYGPYGRASGNAFTLKSSQDNQIIGFRGTSGAYLNSIGAYFGPTPSPAPGTFQKLEGYGGEGGNPWDDGAYDTIRKIYIGQGGDGIDYIKFDYDKDGQLESGPQHGQKTNNTVADEITLNYPDEYLTSMEGYYDNSPGHESPVIQSLKFKTNKRTLETYGFEIGTRFLSEAKVGRIVGFHGRSDNVLNKIGVYIKPSAN